MKKQNESTAALCHMVVTVTPDLAMQITLNGYNKFIVKNLKQKTMMRDASIKRNSTTSVTPVYAWRKSIVYSCE